MSVGLAREELEQLLDGAEADGPHSAALITLLAYNGLRVDEALSRDVEHLGHSRATASCASAMRPCRVRRCRRAVVVLPLMKVHPARLKRVLRDRRARSSGLQAGHSSPHGRAAAGWAAARPWGIARSDHVASGRDVE
jgi:hypothetical protein